MQIAVGRLNSYLVILLSYCVVAVLVAAGPARAGEVSLRAAGIGFSIPVVSLKEARFQTVVKQQYDYSCGSAAVATLLTFHYEKPTNEREVFQAMYDAGDKESIRTKGFSLLDMKNYLKSRGYRAEGYKVLIDKLLKVGVPAIVVINTNGYKHFVVVKGYSPDEILVGDPARGVKIYSRAKFDKVLNDDLVFVVLDHQKMARSHFNQRKDWAVRAKAPFGTALSQHALGNIFINLPGANAF